MAKTLKSRRCLYTVSGDITSMEAKLMLLPAVALVAAVLVIAATPQVNTEGAAKRFASEQDFRNFLKENIEQGGFYGGFYGGVRNLEAVTAQASGLEKSGASSAPDYSATNIQVQGVDEADIVKTDGKYIYVISQNSLIIIDAYPGEDAKIVSNTTLNGTPQEMFVNGDRLIVFGYSQYQNYFPKPLPLETAGADQDSENVSPAQQADAQPGAAGKIAAGFARPIYYSPKLFIKVFDISDRASPELKRDIVLDGSYYDSRMIGDYVYIVANQPVQFGDGPVPLPAVYRDNKAVPAFDYTDVSYFPYPDYSYRFTDIISLNLQDESQEISHNPYLLGDAQTLYVSQDNIFIAGQKQVRPSYYTDTLTDVLIPLLPEDVKLKINDAKNSDAASYEKFQKISEIINEYQSGLSDAEKKAFQDDVEKRSQEIQQQIQIESQKTVIHKLAISSGRVEYKARGEVSGTLLNQFSMDESNGYFRIATTTGGIWTGSEQTPTKNNIYVLDPGMNIAGKLGDLAPGERIYSVRFLGDKAYMVTFRQVDPLFVIDLSIPESPKVLGFLKIPGVSDYLHPYDENHVIGVGRDASEEGRIKGMKLSLFDVSDVVNPKEVSKYYIGGPGTYSEALHDHKAFLFSREKSLLVIPATEYEKDYRPGFQGAYVFTLTAESGFELKGRITHDKENGTQKGDYYYFNAPIRRSLYIGSNLYTLSDRTLKINSLDDLAEIKSIELPYNEPEYVLYAKTEAGVSTPISRP